MKVFIILVVLAMGALAYRGYTRVPKPEARILLLQDKSASMKTNTIAFLSREDHDRLCGLVDKGGGTYAFGVIGDRPDDFVRYEVVKPGSVYQKAQGSLGRDPFDQAVIARLERPLTRLTNLHAALQRASTFFAGRDGTRNYMILVSDGLHDADRSLQPTLKENVVALVVSPSPLKNFANARHFEAITDAVRYIQEN